MACSLAGHMLILEAELPVQCVPVSLRSGDCADGTRLQALSTKSLVPVLRLSDGRLLTENLAVLSALADMAPERGYLHSRQTDAGLSALEWLSFTATEIHKLCLYPIFQKSAPDEAKRWSRGLLADRLTIASDRLQEHPWLAGESFTVADAYFGWALLLCPHAGVELTAHASLQAYWQRLLQRPAFARVVAEEQRLYRTWA
jgi:glutathione S-transferase